MHECGQVECHWSCRLQHPNAQRGGGRCTLRIQNGQLCSQKVEQHRDRASVGHPELHISVGTIGTEIHGTYKASPITRVHPLNIKGAGSAHHCMHWRRLAVPVIILVEALSMGRPICDPPASWAALLCQHCLPPSGRSSCLPTLLVDQGVPLRHCGGQLERVGAAGGVSCSFALRFVHLAGANPDDGAPATCPVTGEQNQWRAESVALVAVAPRARNTRASQFQETEITEEAAVQHARAFGRA